MVKFTPPGVFTLYVILVTGCGDQGVSGPAPVSGPVAVDAHTVGKQRLSDETLAIGTLRSEESIEVSSSVTERIVEIHFDDGQFVKKGELLAELASDEEAAMLAGAKAELDEEVREVARLTALTKRNAVAVETLDTRKTAEVVAQVRIAQMEAMLADRTIKAPFAGVVGLRRISPGALVEPGSVITTLDKIDEMKLDFTVPEVFLGTLKSGVEIEASSAAFPDQTFRGEIAMVDTRIDPVTRSVAVRAIIPNENKTLRPGMLMTVMLERNARNALVVPERAISPIRDISSVFLIKPDQTVELVEVELGRRIPGFVEVLAGLKEGDSIVTDGVINLKDGASVEVKGEFSGPVKGFDPIEQNPVAKESQ